MKRSDFDYIYNADGTCHLWYCGKPGVVLAYDEFSPEGALWFCSECWQEWEEADGFSMLIVVEDRR